MPNSYWAMLNELMHAVLHACGNREVLRWSCCTISHYMRVGIVEKGGNPLHVRSNQLGKPRLLYGRLALIDAPDGAAVYTSDAHHMGDARRPLPPPPTAHAGT